MGKKQAVESEIYAQLANYKKLNAIKKAIENSESGGITRSLSDFERGAEDFASKIEMPGGYEYAQGGFERIDQNAAKMKKISQDYKAWRESQIAMRVRVTEEMQKIDTKVWDLQNSYNADKDKDDFFGIHIAGNPFER